MENNTGEFTKPSNYGRTKQHYRPQYYITQLQVPHNDIDVSFSKLQYKFTEAQITEHEKYTLAKPYNFRTKAIFYNN